MGKLRGTCRRRQAEIVRERDKEIADDRFMRCIMRFDSEFGEGLDWLAHAQQLPQRAFRTGLLQ